MVVVSENLLSKRFFSPTTGEHSADEMFLRVKEYIGEEPDDKHNLIIGSDSHVGSNTLFITAVIVHRVGHGGRYFYARTRYRKLRSMRQRIFYEATMSLEVASMIRGRLKENGLSGLPLEIHLDVGVKGETRGIIKEVVGMITRFGLHRGDQARFLRGDQGGGSPLKVNIDKSGPYCGNVLFVPFLSSLDNGRGARG